MSGLWVFPMNTATTEPARRGVRVAAAAAMLIPAIVLAAGQILMTPNPELWLSNHFRGITRPDAFDHLTEIAPVFCTSVGVLFGLAVVLVLNRRSEYLIPLFSEPTMLVLLYITIEGLSDPDCSRCCLCFQSVRLWGQL